MNQRTQIDLDRVALVAREQWQQDPHIRAEFLHDEETFIAYRKAEAMGLTRLCGPRPNEE